MLFLEQLTHTFLLLMHLSHEGRPFDLLRTGDALRANFRRPCGHAIHDCATCYNQFSTFNLLMRRNSFSLFVTRMS